MASKIFTLLLECDLLKMEKRVKLATQMLLFMRGDQQLNNRMC